MQESESAAPAENMQGMFICDAFLSLQMISVVLILGWMLTVTAFFIACIPLQHFSFNCVQYSMAMVNKNAGFVIVFVLH